MLHVHITGYPRVIKGQHVTWDDLSARALVCNKSISVLHVKNGYANHPIKCIP
jgi:hypothetical protein